MSTEFVYMIWGRDAKNIYKNKKKTKIFLLAFESKKRTDNK